ncbi:hypothetical protein KP509_20G018600 [Ceratopteris richardii]|nr:hypothetical protein KP509_20G018600 [Ceratopteris richardii]KAH7331174.1 hypothetical protein KP509_20G018600 [Ceratopteris richardii]
MGCKLASVDVGAPAVRMAYSPAGGHCIVAVLEDWTIKSCDLDTEHIHVLHSPDKKTDKLAGINVEVHIALTPLHPWLFFGAHRQMIVNVVGTIEGTRGVTKIKTDLKKPITDLACHPRSPLLYVAYLDGVVRAYNIQSFNVHYTLQIDSSINTIKLVGAGAIAFHSTLEWVFVGDRSGTLVAWDVSVPIHPNMIGITQVGSNSLPTVAWNSKLKLLITLTKEGNVQAWRTRANSNPNRPPLKAQFFEPAGMEPFDIASILAQQGGEVVFPLPRIKELLVHSKLNLTTCIFSSPAKVDESRARGATLSREGRKQLFAVLQSARGSPGSVLKEKLAILGSAGILPDQQLLSQMQQSRGQTGQYQLTVADLARKAFLHNNSASGKVKTGPISKLPLLTITDQKYMLRDIPVCQPIHQELRFFNSEQRIFDYPVRVFFMDGCNLMAYNLTSGEYNIYKKLSPTALGGNERSASRMLHSTKQHLFLVFFECRGATSEVVLYRDQVDMHTATERVITSSGCDGAFIGSHENHYAILEDDGLGLSLFTLSESSETKADKAAEDGESTGALDVNTFSQANLMRKTHDALQQHPISFVFYSPVQRIFSTPLDSSLLYSIQGSHIGLAKLSAESLGIENEVFEISTKLDDGPCLSLKQSEAVLQVSWQAIPSGYVAGVLTTSRVMILSSKLEILACSSTNFDNGFPSFRSLVWAGPALLFSSATTIAILGWDGMARTLVSISTPNAALVGFLNDRVLLACPTNSNPRQKQGVDIRTLLVGLLEPMLIGWATMQKTIEPKLQLAELMFQLTSRFDSLRVTPRLLDTLATSSSIGGDLSVELALAGPQFTQVLRCHYAILARRFNTAISILKDEFLRSRDYPKCPPTSRLFQRFRELGRACIKFGQFDLAKETFEVISDYESLLDLFICHLNPSALRRLAQKLEESGVNPELQRQCAKILSVRSASWGQGTLLANFAADSMLPKGPEWGGGNWEVKTPAQVRSIPEWELSNEVTAYMKTPNGPIPTIIPDHLGVYLGTLKGRGTVIEVKETALVKQLVTAQTKENGISEGMNLEILDKIKAAEEAKVKAGPRHGLQDLMHTPASNLADEQAKAEKEFKKFGTDDSSDEEDDATQKRKIKFVIKPAEGTGVDVNKVKVATQQLRVGPVGLLPPISRTRSSSQDLLQLTGPPLPPLPASATPSTLTSGGFQVPQHGMPGVLQTPTPVIPVNSQGPPQMMMGMGVTAGPIPEDFFENTTSAMGALAAFQSGANNTGAGFPSQEGSSWPPTAQAQFMDGPSKGSGVPNISGLPGAGVPSQVGVPFQVGQVPGGMDPFAGGVPPIMGGTASVDPFAGGVPPTAMETGIKFGERSPMMNDLGALAMPTAGTMVTSAPIEASKTPLIRPSSPPFVPRPGQVPRGAPASKCFKAGIAHLEVNQLTDALACLDEGFLALAKDESLGQDIKAQATICAQYKLAVLLLQEIQRLQKVQGPNALSAKDEIARLARHLSTLPLWAKHRTMCIRTAIKRNMDVQNFSFAKSMLDLLLSKAPPNKQDELRSLINICVQRGLSDKSIDPSEDPSEFCAATLGRLPTIGHDVCDVCGSKFSLLSSPLCTICGMGTVSRSDSVAKGAAASPFS